MAGSFKPYRRTAIAASAVGVRYSCATAVTGSGRAPRRARPPPMETAGTASAIAQSYKVNPTTAALSLGISFGVSLAGYTNNVAQAESRAIDLGIIGSTTRRPRAATAATQRCQPRTSPTRCTPTRATRTPAPGKARPRSYVPHDHQDGRRRLFADRHRQHADGTARAPGFADLHRRCALTGHQPHLVDGTREAVGNQRHRRSDDLGRARTRQPALERDVSHWCHRRHRWLVHHRQDEGARPGCCRPATSVGALEQANAAPRAGRRRDRRPEGPHGGWNPVRRPAVDPCGAIRSPRQHHRRNSRRGAAGPPEPVRHAARAGLRQRHLHPVSDIAIGSVTGAGSFSLELGGVQASSGASKTTNFLIGRLPLHA